MWITRRQPYGLCPCGCEVEKEFRIASEPVTVRLPFSTELEESYVVKRGADLNLTCVPVESPNATVKWTKDKGRSLDELVSSNDTNILQLRDIQKSENYTCEAESIEDGHIERAKIIIVQDLPLAPVNLKVSQVTESSLRLAWSYPTSSSMSTLEPNDPNVQHYTILIRPFFTGKSFEISGISERHHTIQQLNHSKEYVFYVRAVNLIGEGPLSERYSATTKGPPPKFSPAHVRARYLSLTSLMISWMKPSASSDDYEGIRVGRLSVEEELADTRTRSLAS
ncbi:unnamed protein product [Darwinula stevensoni]|uniref:Uncharacterized protein n=1 Tax=Darwinula stevensoni TaxID=69355 RepID=A0A7R8XDF7_9CRUS|nr:unnamed protein product [Darwinula stevensoni]CAG0893203.1 unnamed protein product [Darwinula stevensoni]